MSVLGFLSPKETTAEINYLKETILIEEKAPTKIILRFIVSYDENEYDALSETDNPMIIVKIPSSISVIEDSVEITQYKLVCRDLVKDSFKPKDYDYLSPEGPDITERYIKAFEIFGEEIDEKWVGMHWKPREDTADYRFHAPLYPSLRDVRTQDILIELPHEKPPSINGKCNVGLMLNFYTEDIPLRKGFILETRIDINNTEGRDYQSLPEEKIINIEKGELWILNPENSLISLSSPEPDKIISETKEDEEIIQKYSKKLFGVGRWPFYKPKPESVLLRWDIDKHIRNWESNNLTFISQALLVDTFWRSIHDSIMDEVRSIINREFELLMKRAFRKEVQSQQTFFEPAEMKLEKGTCYLLEGEETTKGYEIFLKYIENYNGKGLCMVRGRPHPLLGDVEPGIVEIVDLNTTGSPDTISPSNDKAIIARINEFLKKRENSIIFFDVLDYIFYSTDFAYLMNLLNTIIDIVKISNSILLAIANPIVFEKQISILTKQFELIDLTGSTHPQGDRNEARCNKEK